MSNKLLAGELAESVVREDGTLDGDAVERVAVVTPTQMRRPWRAMVRTIFQAALALATLIPLVVAGLYEDKEAIPAIVLQVLTVCGLVTRVMSMPAVEEFLRRYLPFLAAAPPPPPTREQISELFGIPLHSVPELPDAPEATESVVVETPDERPEGQENS